MGTEIERKFLVTDAWRSAVDLETYTWIQQGYLSLHPERIVRLRDEQQISPRGYTDSGFLTIKGLTVGNSRSEWEYPISAVQVREMMALVEGAVIEKKRYQCGRFEIDELSGANEGLVVAEIELEFEAETFERPPWLGEEVSGDERYYNANLVTAPYSGWASAAVQGEGPSLDPLG